jgi:phospholipase/carboxylesterase
MASPSGPSRATHSPRDAVSYLDRTALVDGGPALVAAGLAHRVRQPARAGPHPTIVMLHGLDGDESAMWLLGPALPRDWLVVAPRAPLAGPGGGRAWRRPDGREWATLAAFDDSVSDIRRLAGALPELYGADPDRIYGMGFSQGGALSIAVAIRCLGLFCALACLVGFVPEETSAADLAAMAGLPVFMAIGRRDPLVPIDRARAGAAALSGAGADLECRTYDAGHKLTSVAMADLRAWFEGVPVRVTE